MHELSLMRNILEIARRNIPAGAEHDVKEIHLRIGLAAGVVSDSLEFCFTVLTQDTPLENSKLVIEEVPLTIQCGECQSVGTREELYLICPVCGSNNVSILSGMELEVSSIELMELEKNIP